MWTKIVTVLFSSVVTMKAASQPVYADQILISKYFKHKYPAFEVICSYLWPFLQSDGRLRPSD